MRENQSLGRVFGLALCIVVGLKLSAFGSGAVTGQGRFERIAGNPSQGYKHLYEWDLFLSPSDNSMIGPARRLGAPPGEPPRGDGYYHIGGLPAGAYSAYVNQPDFFASPKVVPDVEIIDNQTTTVNVDLDVDYSTYYRDSGQWTEWQWDWYQTFTATGTAVRGVSWVMAGWGLYDGKTAQVRILEDDGDSDVRNWAAVGSGMDGHLGSDSDEWVRWDSGDVPLTAGKQYAVNVHIDGGMAVYKRNKDAQSYSGGRAYDQSGNPMDFDLNVTVFVDRGQMVTHTSKSPGPGDFDGSLHGTRWGQTFVATGSALAAADLFAASGQADLELAWTIREDGPAGPQVGPTKTTHGAYFASSTDLVGVSYNPGEVELVPGGTYYIEAVNTSAGFTPYTRPPSEQYEDGQAYRSGTAVPHDLSMTIMEYAFEDWVTLVESGSTWSYLDDGSNQGIGWREPGFVEDPPWSMGRAQLGYGDGDEETELSYGSNPQDKYPTTYFRTTFEVEDAEDIGSLMVDIIYDDGVAVYLNGDEVRRLNLEDDAAFDDYAGDPRTTEVENNWVTFPIDVGALVDGDNLLAVEIHQSNATSSDLSFDLRLRATVIPEPTTATLLLAAGLVALFVQAHRRRGSARETSGLRSPG